MTRAKSGEPRYEVRGLKLYLDGTRLPVTRRAVIQGLRECRSLGILRLDRGCALSASQAQAILAAERPFALAGLAREIRAA